MALALRGVDAEKCAKRITTRRDGPRGAGPFAGGLTVNALMSLGRLERLGFTLTMSSMDAGASRLRRWFFRLHRLPAHVIANESELAARLPGCPASDRRANYPALARTCGDGLTSKTNRPAGRSASEMTAPPLTSGK
jgi:hypothetical protein